MNIRALRSSDLPILRQIHEEYYKHEFNLPNFSSGFNVAYVVEDDDRQIISAGGIRPIIESVILTDKRQSVRKRREALYDILAASTHFGRKDGYNQIHAFVQDPSWENHLKKNGFYDTKGLSLVLDI